MCIYIYIKNGGVEINIINNQKIQNIFDEPTYTLIIYCKIS